MKIFRILSEKILVLFLFISLMFSSGCANKNNKTTIQVNNNPHIDINETNKFMGNDSEGNTTGLLENNNPINGVILSDNTNNLDPTNVPTCEEITLNQNIDIVNIEDVLVNCSDETGFSYYDNAGIGGLESLVMLYRNNFTRGFQDFQDGTICYSDKTEFNIGLDNESLGFIEFLKKYQINEKGLILVARDKLGVPYGYYCDDKNLCDNLNGKTWGNSNGHYYVYGFRSYESTGTPLLVIDDKLYSVGKAELLDNSELLKQGIWNVVGFSGNKLILNRYHDNKYLDEYDFLYLDYFNNNIKNGTVVSKFILTTCEFAL